MAREIETRRKTCRTGRRYLLDREQGFGKREGTKKIGLILSFLQGSWTQEGGGFPGKDAPRKRRVGHGAAGM